MRRRFIESGGAFALGFGALSTMHAVSGVGWSRLSPLVLVWDAGYVGVLCLLLSGVGWLLGPAPWAVRMLWLVPTGFLSTVACMVVPWVVYGGWGPPVTAAHFWVGVLVGAAMVWVWRPRRAEGG